MFYGLSEEQARSCFISSQSKFPILPEVEQSSQQYYKHSFKELQNVLSMILSTEEIESLFRALSFVLHMSLAEFEPDHNYSKCIQSEATDNMIALLDVVRTNYPFSNSQILE